MLVNRALPGLEPDAVNIRLQRRPDGLTDVWVWQGTDLRYLRLDEADRYTDLSSAEAADVLYAVIDSAGLFVTD